MEEGKYIYCIIGTKQERNFGPIGTGERGNEVLTIGYDDLSMVVSSHPLGKLIVNRENMLAHEKVIEKVMEEFDAALPVRFGTVASSADEIRGLLDRRYREFKNLLMAMDHKIELGVKGIWKNMDEIFNEIVAENREIKGLKAEIEKQKDKKNIQAKMAVGKMIEDALQAKKEKESGVIIEKLKKTSLDYKLNKTISDEMFINAAFLVDKGREKEFDNIMADLDRKYKNRAKFMYAGPLPPYNFVNITIYPGKWEA
ncbi:GvpL/GvpF family gas vesicle protein [Candidatus Saganbacteria bacterium]|nr:GvpL/GvpF family gas vesicle protein [Candidatus Saganbacteria bacterium]